MRIQYLHVAEHKVHAMAFESCIGKHQLDSHRTLVTCALLQERERERRAWYPITQPPAAKTDVGGETVVAKKRQQEREYL